MSWRARGVLGLSLLVLVGACQGGTTDEPSSTNEQATKAFGEHHIKEYYGRPFRHFGENCSDHGSAECLSGFCIHTLPDPNRGFVCSEECGPMHECPSGWRCLRLHPQATNQLCFPGKEGGR
jgi:hypothetical protein